MILLLIGCTVQIRAEELRLTAADAFRQGEPQPVRLSADGQSIELMRGILVENDGAAAGYSYRPNEETLTEGLTAYQRLNVDFPRPARPANGDKLDQKQILPRAAYLLVGHNGKSLAATINGASVPLSNPLKAGNYWKQYAIPPELLVAGANEIGLSGDGKLWIAREDERALWPFEKDEKREQSSYKLVKESGDHRLLKLGPKNDIAGEYYIRLYLDGYRDNGFINTTTYDAANLAGNAIPAPNVRVKSISVQLEGDESGGELRAAIHWASKPNRAEIWMHPSAESHLKIVPETNRPLPRYFNAVARLNPATFEKTPKLTGIRIQTEIEADPGWGDKLRIIDRQTSPLRHWFRFEKLDHPKLAQFRRDYHLEEVVKGCQTDLQRMEKLAVWTSQQWTKGHLSSIYPKWDACEILKKHEDGTPVGGFCQQFNIVFLQACEAFGMPGRCVSIGAGDHGVKIRSGHEVVEIWSNELSKWVYVDGQAAWYFVDKETREPLNLLELRERQLATLLDRPLRAESKRPVDVVVLAKSPYEWKDLTEWPAFTELRMIPHTQFLDGELPLPLNQGMRGWFWTGHRVWTDDLYPASVLYSSFVTSTSDWNFPINQTQIWLQQNVKVGDLDVRLENNMPSFAKYEVQLDDQSPRFEEQPEFKWPLHAGENRLQVRAVSKLGLKGPPSWFKVEYKP